jgi:hypothetical protein
VIQEKKRQIILTKCVLCLSSDFIEFGVTQAKESKIIIIKRVLNHGVLALNFE